MKSTERKFITSVLSAIVLLVLIDLITDSTEGVKWWHLAVEAGIAFISSVGIFLIVKDSFRLKNNLERERQLSSQLLKEAEMWRNQSRKYIAGLSATIDDQLNNWHLTGSEKEIAFLILKGLSLKEIAELRQTSERTVRTQSISIYSKAGLKGRSELSAFFLEDLLPPETEANRQT